MTRDVVKSAIRIRTYFDIDSALHSSLDFNFPIKVTLEKASS